MIRAALWTSWTAPSWEKIRKLLETGRRSRDAVSPNSSPGTETHSWEDLTNPQLLSEGHHTWGLHGRQETLKCLSLTTSKAYIQRTQRSVRNQDNSLKGITFTLPPLGPKNAKAAVWKVLRLYVKEIDLLILKRQREMGLSLETEVQKGTIFALFFHHAKHRGACTFLVLSCCPTKGGSHVQATQGTYLDQLMAKVGVLASLSP